MGLRFLVLEPSMRPTEKSSDRIPTLITEWKELAKSMRFTLAGPTPPLLMAALDL